MSFDPVVDLVACARTSPFIALSRPADYLTAAPGAGAPFTSPGILDGPRYH